MFFGPTIARLVQQHHEIHILGITTGNFRGLGSVRKREMISALSHFGFPSENITILDMEKFKDGRKYHWDIEALSYVILTHIKAHNSSIIITFDEYGISGHPNHISCFYALKFLYMNGSAPFDMKTFVLNSFPSWRRYLYVFDLFFAYFADSFFYIASPKDVLSIYVAMSEHRSQLYWNNLLYLTHSRYLFVNSYTQLL